MLDKINNGQGTLGQLLVNPSLYRIAGRHHAGDARPDEGFPRQSQKVPAHQAGPVSDVRKLVVNADDFGFTRDVNQGIVEAHRQGILTATTLMATGAAFDDAVRLARENPKLDIGVPSGPGGRAAVSRHRRAAHARRGPRPHSHL